MLWLSNFFLMQVMHFLEFLWGEFGTVNRWSSLSIPYWSRSSHVSGEIWLTSAAIKRWSLWRRGEDERRMMHSHRLGKFLGGLCRSTVPARKKTIAHRIPPATRASQDLRQDIVSKQLNTILLVILQRKPCITEETGLFYYPWGNWGWIVGFLRERQSAVHQ